MKSLEEIYGELLADFQTRTGLEVSSDGDLAVRFYAVAAQLHALYLQAAWTADGRGGVSGPARRPAGREPEGGRPGRRNSALFHRAGGERGPDHSCGHCVHDGRPGPL